MGGMPGMPSGMMGGGMPEQNSHVNGVLMGSGAEVEAAGSDGFQGGYVPAAGGSASAAQSGTVSEISRPESSQAGFQPQIVADTGVATPDAGYAGRGAAARGARGGRVAPTRPPSVPGAMMRGRGRGLGFGAAEVSHVTRAPSPLPPNVPTGPRNRSTYKDKDREPVKQDVDGLDYGGGVSNESSNSRKRPHAGDEDNGRSKRR